MDFKTKAYQETKKDPAIPLLGIYPKKPKALIQKDTCILMFTAALFTIAQIGKQSRCPSVEEWTKNLWYIYTMLYYLTIKRKKFYPL